MEFKPATEFYLTATGRLTRYCKVCFPVKKYMISLHAREAVLFKRSPAWARCLDYWHHTCAMCGRGEGCSLMPDHWQPFYQHWQAGCTVPANIVPLCRVCNGRKGGKLPERWLIHEFGETEAQSKLARVEAYFVWVRQQDAL